VSEENPDGLFGALPEQRDSRQRVADEPVRHCRLCKVVLMKDDYLAHRLCAECEAAAEW
jgi:hypothetical protein